MRASLITTQRICRVFEKRADSICLERRTMRRKANKLRQYLPFTTSSMADIEQVATNHRSPEWDDLHKVLTGFGRSLVLDTEGLRFDRLCDLLAITMWSGNQRAKRAWPPWLIWCSPTRLRKAPPALSIVGK